MAPRSATAGDAKKSRAATLIELSGGLDKPVHAKAGDLTERLLEARRRAGAPVARAPEADAQPSSAAPAPPAAAAHAPPSAAPAAAPAPRPVRRPAFEEIVTYWDAFRHGKRFPSWSDFDAQRIGRDWPDSLLLDCGPDARRAPKVLKMARLGQPESGSGVEYTPTMIEWILSLAREVARTGEALQDSEEFLSAGGNARYRIVLLPLGDQPASVDRVLGSVCRM